MQIQSPALNNFVLIAFHPSEFWYQTRAIYIVNVQNDSNTALVLTFFCRGPMRLRERGLAVERIGIYKTVTSRIRTWLSGKTTKSLLVVPFLLGNGLPKDTCVS